MTASPGSPDLSTSTVEHSTVSLAIPADVAYVSVVRSLTASLAARCSLTIDEIEDLRIAVDEACALLLTLAVPGSSLQAGFELQLTSITVTVDVEPLDGVVLDRNGFGWTVLDALARITDVRDGAGSLGITMYKQAEEAVDTDGPATP